MKISSDQTLNSFIELNRKSNDQQLKLLNMLADKRKEVDDLMGILLLICDGIQRGKNNGFNLLDYLTMEESETLSVLLERYGKGYKK